MKVAQLHTVPDDVMQDEKFIPLISNHLLCDLVKSSMRLGRKVINAKVEIGKGFNDFIHATTTIRVEADSYKVPRILKRKKHHK